MKKLLVSTCILTALGLAGCGGETIEDLQAETPVETPFSRVLFDPANGNLNIPNDLLMLPSDGQTFDYTLNIPVTDASDFSDPQNALNTQDGWSTNYPFQLEVTVPAGVSLDESTLSAGIRIFEATLGLDIADPDCQAIAVPSAGCKMGDELQFGVDFVLRLADRDTISVVPLKPFKAAQGHMLVITDALKDSSGKGVKGSTTWDLVKQDINVNPLSSPSQLDLQGLVNSYVTALEQVSITRDELSYVQVFTTQSIDAVLSTVKQLQVQEFGVTSAAGMPSMLVNSASTFQNAHQAIVDEFALDMGSIAGALGLPTALDYSSLETCTGVLPAAAGSFLAATGQTTGDATTDGAVNAGVAQIGMLFAPNCAANLYEGSTSLTYYSAVPTAENPTAPVNEFWSAACDSGIVIQGAMAAGLLANATAGPNAELCTAVGLGDFRLGDAMLDSARRLTKFSPVPQAQGRESGKETLDVQITVPNVGIAQALGQTLEMPEDGWPVVMLVHGITSQKEAMLNISGALSLAGFATVAIDQPIHGSRGFDLTGNGTDDLNATTVSATHFLNLASLPTARDNSKQAVADLLGVRLGLNAIGDLTGAVNLDETNVSVMGVSLGAITGGMFASLANEDLPGDAAPFSSLYDIKAASLESPGGGIANFLLESQAFGPLVKGSLLSQGSPDFQAYLAQVYGDAEITEAQLGAATVDFLAALTDEQAAAVNSLFAQFAFAAQTMTDSSDPINYFTKLGENTPVHMMTVVGDGTDANVPDTVIPPTTALPLSGQIPLATLMDLPTISSSVSLEEPTSGLVLFNSGAHASSLSFASSPAVYAEMQKQVAAYMQSGGRTIAISDEDVVQN
ncbi:MAG: VolA/Pla-1 family phospholipase [Glaciecola sp.]